MFSRWLIPSVTQQTLVAGQGRNQKPKSRMSVEMDTDSAAEET